MKVPGPADITVALERLPEGQRFVILHHAVNMVFQGFLSGSAYAPEDRVLSDEVARDKAGERESLILQQLYAIVERDLPELFGPEGENPAWSENAGLRPVVAEVVDAPA